LRFAPTRVSETFAELRLLESMDLAAWNSAFHRFNTEGSVLDREAILETVENFLKATEKGVFDV